MKGFIKISFAVLGLVFLQSCNNDAYEITGVQARKIDSVIIDQDTMTIFNMQPIKVFSTYNKECEGFYGVDYIPQDSTRTVVNYAYKNNQTCQEGTYRAFNLIRFEPQKKGTYYFKFWQGKNASGENTWLEKQIVVE